MTIRRSNPHNRGFTLVELSIVLVIIGLIIGGVLTGQQIIQNARVTNAINAIQSYGAQFQTYTQNNGAAPGDDAGAAARYPTAGLPNSASGGNGTIEGAYDAACGGTPLSSTESCLAWGDLRAAGLIKNQVPITAQPANPFNGIFGFQNGAFTGSTSALTTAVLCMSNVPGSAAVTIDTRLDDGASGTGTIQASATGATGAVAGSYDPTATYTMCVKM